MLSKYKDRADAGKRLADYLAIYANQPQTIVLGLPRGGVPVADEIAKKLHLPLDIFLVRKLGVPDQEELAMGAIAMQGVIFLNQAIIKQLGINRQSIERVQAEQQKILVERELRYRGNRLFPSLADKTIILVDDGIATGATIQVAMKALRQFNPKKIVVAVPVMPKEMVADISALADELMCPLLPDYFSAVGSWYDYFPQTSDEEVQAILAR